MNRFLFAFLLSPFFIILFFVSSLLPPCLLPLRGPQDPRVYVTALLDVHRKYSTLVQESFSSDQGFTMALDKVGLASSFGVMIGGLQHVGKMRVDAYHFFFSLGLWESGQ